MFKKKSLNFCFSVYDDQELDEGRDTQSEESLSRKEARDDEHQP